MMNTTEMVVLLDDAGAPIGQAPKASVHTTDTPLHLAFSCYLLNRTGELLLTRNAGNDLVLWLRDWHVHLLAGKNGEQVLGAVGIASIFMLLSGLYLWWPRLSALAASLKWYRGPPTRRWFSWHRGIGLWLLPLTLLSAVTGTAMVYDEVARGALRADDRGRGEQGRAGEQRAAFHRHLGKAPHPRQGGNHPASRAGAQARVRPISCGASACRRCAPRPRGPAP